MFSMLDPVNEKHFRPTLASGGDSHFRSHNSMVQYTALRWHCKVYARMRSFFYLG